MVRAPMEILLADDNAEDVMVIQMLFGEANKSHGINFVRNGEDVLSYLRNEGTWSQSPRPGLILLDINMPKRNGFEVLEEIKADAALRSIPIIVLSTSAEKVHINRAFELGASSFITKPAKFDHFREVMAQFVRYWTHVSHVP